MHRQTQRELLDMKYMRYFCFSFKVCTWLFAVVAIVWLCVACFFWANRIVRQQSWVKATAVVTTICEVKHGEIKTKHSCLTFTDPQTGNSVTVNSQMGASKQPIYPIGDSVEVIFPAGQPKEAIENNFIVNYLEPLMFTVIAILFGLVSFVSFSISRKLEIKLAH